jgi:hypothetical protein
MLGSAKDSRVKKASEYRRHAEECRALAKQMKQGEYRDQLLIMAETWDRLAAEREAALPAELKPAVAEPAKN